LGLNKRQKRSEEQKQEKKERQRSEQRKLRGKSKQNSKVVELRKEQAGKSVSRAEPMELLPERVSSEQMKPQTPVPPPQIPEPAASGLPTEERHKLVIPKNQTLKRIW
jgi:putative transposase